KLRAHSLRQQAGRTVRIAQVAPLVLPVPPVRYGGTERVIFALTEELVRLGHDVTLFAAGTSRTSARLIPCSPRPLWDLDPSESVAYPQVPYLSSSATASTAFSSSRRMSWLRHA